MILNLRWGTMTRVRKVSFAKIYLFILLRIATPLYLAYQIFIYGFANERWAYFLEDPNYDYGMVRNIMYNLKYFLGGFYIPLVIFFVLYVIVGILKNLGYALGLDDVNPGTGYAYPGRNLEDLLIYRSFVPKLKIFFLIACLYCDFYYTYKLGQDAEMFHFIKLFAI
jgi:hypothetical protein